MAASRLGYLYLAYFSQPKAQRALYRHIRRHRPARIVEIGVGAADRAANMIRVAQRYAQGRQVHYTGIDPFESSPHRQSHVSLKDAHRRLAQSGARVRLIPGDPLSALSMAANGLTRTDLLVISADQQGPALDASWFYVPRMLHETSHVFCEASAARGDSILQPLLPLEIEKLARATRPRRAA